jgi:hypothetical protein
MDEKMNSRLELIDKDFDESINSFSLKNQRKAIDALIEFSIDVGDIRDDNVVNCLEYLRNHKKIPKDVLDKLRSSVEKLDDEYLTLSDEFNDGLGREQDVLKAFAKARNLNALFLAADPDANNVLAEMIYEINAGQNNLAEIKRIVAESIS